MEVLSGLLRRKLPLSEEETNALLKWCADDPQAGPWSHPLAGVAATADNFAAQNELFAITKGLLSRFLERLQMPGYHQNELRKPAERIMALLGRAPQFPIERGEAWSDAAQAQLSKLAAEKQTAWIALLGHCANATSANPSKKWLKTSASLVDEVGFAEFKNCVLEWFPLVDRPRTGGSRIRNISKRAR